MSGRIQFGVERTFSFVTFLEEPVTRFSVTSELGGDSFKINDIPQLSEFIIKGIKKFITQRFVYPNSHKMKLIWPRSWWPVDARGTCYSFYAYIFLMYVNSNVLLV